MQSWLAPWIGGDDGRLISKLTICCISISLGFSSEDPSEVGRLHCFIVLVFFFHLVSIDTRHSIISNNIIILLPL
eukprot:UN14038